MALQSKGQYILYGLFAVLGVSAWIAINGVFQELPIFARQQPEGWAIGAYLSAAIQVCLLL